MQSPKIPRTVPSARMETDSEIPHAASSETTGNEAFIVPSVQGAWRKASCDTGWNAPLSAADAGSADGPLFIRSDGRASHKIPINYAQKARLRLLLLDFDGTLADTREANCRAYVRMFGEKGLTLSAEEYNDRYFGMRCTEFMERMGIADPAERERLRLRKIALYPSFFDTVRLNRPLWEFAQAFRAKGGRVWIVSTGSRDNILNVMKHLRIAGGVDGILTGADAMRSKPAPDGFLRAMELEGTAPAETLIFEDSAIGLEAARRSGAPYIAVKF